MRKTILAACVWLAATVPAPAQTQLNPPPPSPMAVPANGFAPLLDHPACTRDELKAATDAYVKAQSRGDISALPLAPNAHYLENMKTIDAKAGLWNVALPVVHAQSFHDDKRCKAFTEIIVTDGGHPYVIGTRLYLHAGKIIRIDSLVSDKGDHLFNARATLKFTKLEGDWQDLEGYERTEATEMMRGANAYMDAFADKFTGVPWGSPCLRIEGGHYSNVKNEANPTCNRGIPSGVYYIINRDFLIDEEKGVVNVFCRFPYSKDVTGPHSEGMPDSHSFRFIYGKIRNVHTITVNETVTPSAQSDDNGVILGN